MKVALQRTCIRLVNSTVNVFTVTQIIAEMAEEANNNNNNRVIMTPEERRANCMSFIQSDKFGGDTWLTLTVFNKNIIDVESTMYVYYSLLKKLDEEFLAKLMDKQIKVPDQDILRTKQLIATDIILKAEIIVESSLVFIYELSNGYSELPKRMARYALEFVQNKVMKKVWEKDFYLQRGLGVPSIANMQLEEHEEALLQAFYEQAEDNAWVQLGKLADFYDKYKTVYNKYRHGLILRTGLTPTNGNKDTSNSNGAFDLDNSALEALDNKNANDLPKGCIMVERDVNNLVPGMFNVLSHVNFGPKLMQEVFDIVSITQQLISYVCENHKLYAKNCGHSYLPVTFKDGKLQLAFFLPDDALAGNERLLESIANKVIERMNIQAELTGEEFTYRNGKNDSLVQAIQNNAVTNIFVRSKPSKDK
jgi:hypothetical protein